MSDYLTEQEQIELLKSWIKQYSFVILLGVLFSVIAIYGWRYWQERQNNILAHASSVYDEMLTMRAQNNAEDTMIQAKKLFTHYSNTAYGQFAAFMLARDAIAKNNYADAYQQFDWVINHSKQSDFRQIARIRKARLYILEKKTTEALKTLDTIEDKHYLGLISEVRGDAYYAAKDWTKARSNYQEALSALPNAEVTRPILQMKFDNLSAFSQ